MKKIVQKFREYLFMKKAVLVLAMLYALGISAILRADFKYIDDLGRVRYGYRGWNDFSRYLNECLSVVLHADAYLTDISPLPQLTAVLILAVAGSVVVFVLTGKREFCFWNSIAVLPMGLSPYFLECFSYKYDSPYMALSVLASVLPLLLQEQGLFIYFAASVAGSAAMCMTYQASSGILRHFSDVSDTAVFAAVEPGKTYPGESSVWACFNGRLCGGTSFVPLFDHDAGR